MTSGDQQGDAVNGQKKRRWLWPLLIISLGLNLLFVGLVAGRIWNHGYRGHAAARNQIITGAIEKLIEDFPAAKRRRASELLKRYRTTVRPLRGQNKEVRSAVKAAALADPFNEEKLAEALLRLRQIRSGMHQSLHMTMMGLMKDLTLKERQELVNNIRAGFRHRRRHWRHPKGAPGGGPR